MHFENVKDAKSEQFFLLPTLLIMLTNCFSSVTYFIILLKLACSSQCYLCTLCVCFYANLMLPKRNSIMSALLNDVSKWDGHVFAQMKWTWHRSLKHFSSAAHQWCMCVLFVDWDTLDIKEHLIDELDYTLVPTEGWKKLVSWYGLKDGQEPIARKVKLSVEGKPSCPYPL